MTMKKLFVSIILAATLAQPALITASTIVVNGGSSQKNERSLAKKILDKAAIISFYSAELATGIASLNWHLMKGMSYTDAFNKVKSIDKETAKNAAAQTAADVYEANVIAAKTANAYLPASVQNQTKKIAPAHNWVLGQFPIDVTTGKSIAADGKISDQSKEVALWAVHLALITHAANGLYKELVAPLID